MQRKTFLILAVAVVFIGVLLIWRSGASYPITNASAAGGDVVVAFGDSLTQGYGVPREQSWPARLSRRTGTRIINAGVSGDTVADGARRLERDVLSHNPDIVFVGLGGNDMLRRQPREQAMQGLRDIIERIQDSGAMTVVLGLEGAFLLTGDWGEAYEEVARETGSVFVPDILDGVYGNRALMQGDRIHPNAAGYEVITDRIERYAGEWLE